MNPQPTVDNVDILWIVGTFVGLAMLYWLLWKGTRTLGRAIAVRDHGDAKRRLARGQEHLGWIVIAYSALVIVAVPVLFYRVYEDRLLEGLIAAVALLWFLRSQLPTLLPPSVYIGFHHWDRDQQRYMEPASEGDCVQHSVDTFLVLRVMNVGLGAYEGCSVSITLRKDFHITEWAETEESI